MTQTLPLGFMGRLFAFGAAANPIVEVGKLARHLLAGINNGDGLGDELGAGPHVGHGKFPRH